jgi:hypothetical protein
MENLDRRYNGHEAVSTKWGEFSDRRSVSSDDEGFAVVKLTHDLAAVIAEFALSDFSNFGEVVRVANGDA